MAEKYFDDQFDDEEVLYVFRKHPIVMRVGLVVASLGLLAGPLYTLILTYVKSDNPPSMSFFFISILASLVLSAILFLPSWINWYYSVFIVTNQRLIQVTQKGFFHKSVVDLGLGQIQSINYEIAGLQETMLGYGTILIQTYVGDLVIHDLHHPGHIQKRLSQILRDVTASGSGAKFQANKDSQSSEENT